MSDTQNADVLLRPERPGWLKAMAASIPLLILALIFLLFRLATGSRGSEGLGLLAFPALIILLAVPAVWAAIYLTRRTRTMRLTLDAGELRLTTWNGKGWRIPRAEVTHAHYLDVVVPMNSKPTSWVVLTRTGGDAHVLWQSDWPDTGLARIWKQIGCATSRDTVAMREVLARHPSLGLPWWHRHPILGGLAGAVLFIGYVLLVVMPFALLTS
ncbi:hypothetical protein AB0395_12080 [Streptosporangium sp. NPDC051023]|uniref:hypothetical protein n=1 Tax=Streptosporangium sp. NPDC051023 TaxID=3155410 RepID=UPI0034501110